MLSKRNCFFVATISLMTAAALAQTPRWSEEKAAIWYKQQPWLVGSNFIPADAINQLEMWQPETFDPQEIDKELGWAQAIGMNTMRVFLHDLLWQQDSAGFARRLDQFLAICARHNIRPMFVLFDSVWDPNPHLGPQHPPTPGVHNSGWVQSPGRAALADPAQYPRLKAYVQGVVGKFGNDPRVLAWDVWNEPDNENHPSYEKVELPDKAKYVNELLPQVFEWAREMHPIQPLTSGVWRGDYSSLETALPTARIQLEQSDIITFHDYGWPEEFEQRLDWLRGYHRPIVCTEYMARPAGSTFDTILPIAFKDRIGAINWGLVVGKTQTNLPWDSWERPYVLIQPISWFHEVFRADGTPYRQREADIIQSLTSQANGTPAPTPTPISGELTNPLLPVGPDPWVTFKDGYYYYTDTMATNITLWKTRDIADLRRAEKKVIYTPPADAPYSHDLWAPEIHFLDGKWYVYFAADAGTNKTHRIFVLENRNSDPLQGDWKLRGEVSDATNKWAIDPSVFENRGKMYMVWSGWEGDVNGTQNIYIARLKNPWTVEGHRVLLSTPQYDWEKHGDLDPMKSPDDPPHVNVNEGPEVLAHRDKLFLVYSASGCWTDDYELGMLTASADSDLLDPHSWTKSATPVFKGSPEAGVYAPGHNSFFHTPDGRNWILYHANAAPHQGCGNHRSPRAQPFTWNADGSPNFGSPVSTSTPFRER